MKLYRDATVKDGLRVVNNLRPEDRSEMEGIGVSILSLPFGVLISEHAVYFFSKEGKAAGLAGIVRLDNNVVRYGCYVHQLFMMLLLHL